jgi:hypothetical protein
LREQMLEAAKKHSEKCIRERTGGNEYDSCTDCEPKVLDAGKVERNGRATWRPKRVAEYSHKRCIHGKGNDLWQCSSEQPAYCFRQAVIRDDSNAGRRNDARQHRKAEPASTDQDFWF